MSFSCYRLVCVFFYLILSIAAWQICGGIVFALIVAPSVCLSVESLGRFEQSIVWIMIMGLGWSLASWPANKISKVF